MQNAAANDRDTFMRSEQAWRLCEPDSINLPVDSARFLRNRVETAYIAGWRDGHDACAAEENKTLRMRFKIGTWLARGEHNGISSKYMAGIMLGADQDTVSKWLCPWPRDPADFGRCHHLIQCAPEIREHLHLMKRCGEVWSRLVDHWDEMTRLYEKEKNAGNGHELMNLMRSLGA